LFRLVTSDKVSPSTSGVSRLLRGELMGWEFRMRRLRRVTLEFKTFSENQKQTHLKGETDQQTENINLFLKTGSGPKK